MKINLLSSLLLLSSILYGQSARQNIESAPNFNGWKEMQNVNLNEIPSGSFIEGTLNKLPSNLNVNTRLMINPSYLYLPNNFKVDVSHCQLISTIKSYSFGHISAVPTQLSCTENNTIQTYIFTYGFTTGKENKSNGLSKSDFQLDYKTNIISTYIINN
jgi:hypothetical protein